MRDTFLWRLCQKECAWIDCDTKYEWASDVKKLFENWRVHLSEDSRSEQLAVDKVKEVVTLFSGLYNSLPDDASKEIFEHYLNKNVELYTKEWQKERTAEETEIDDDNVEIEF